MTSMQEYLKRYTSDADKKKKKKKKKSKASNGGALTIVDGDPVWQKDVKEDSSESETEKEDAPLVIEDVEFKRMQRLEALRMRPYLATAADGSGWVSISDNQNQELQAKFMGSKEPVGEDGLDAELSSSPRTNEKESSSPRKESDLSPPRKEKDLSPPRKRRHDSPDSSSPREDSSPPQKGLRRGCYHSSESSLPSRDLSPPRKTSISGYQASSILNAPSQDMSPPRRASVRGHHNTVSREMSPPRRQFGRGHQDSPELSTRSEDLSPPRRESKRGAHGSPESLSLQTVRSLDLSPPRREQTNTYKDDRDFLPARRRNRDGLGANDLPKLKRKEIMADGKSAGLQSGRELVKETMMKKQSESKRVKELDITISGRNANTVYRDKHGRRLEGVDEVLKLQQAEEPKKEDKPLEWGKGLVQKREAESQRAELEAEKMKPFARTIQDRDKELREQIRWGDPMAHLVKKKGVEPVLIDLGASEQMKDSGFIIPQEVPTHSWLKRGIAPPSNRYGIKPGRHWDGVDRSTGYERDMYKRQNEKAAEQVEAYLWSVADM